MQFTGFNITFTAAIFDFTLNSFHTYSDFCLDYTINSKLTANYHDYELSKSIWLCLELADPELYLNLYLQMSEQFIICEMLSTNYRCKLLMWNEKSVLYKLTKCRSFRVLSFWSTKNTKEKLPKIYLRING